MRLAHSTPPAHVSYPVPLIDLTGAYQRRPPHAHDMAFSLSLSHPPPAFTPAPCAPAVAYHHPYYQQGSPTPMSLSNLPDQPLGEVGVAPASPDALDGSLSRQNSYASSSCASAQGGHGEAVVEYDVGDDGEMEEELAGEDGDRDDDVGVTEVKATSRRERWSAERTARSRSGSIKKKPAKRVYFYLGLTRYPLIRDVCESFPGWVECENEEDDWVGAVGGQLGQRTDGQLCSHCPIAEWSLCVCVCVCVCIGFVLDGHDDQPRSVAGYEGLPTYQPLCRHQRHLQARQDKTNTQHRRTNSPRPPTPPVCASVCRKHNLARNLMRMRRIFPKEYKFFPKTWILPSGHTQR